MLAAVNTSQCLMVGPRRRLQSLESFSAPNWVSRTKCRGGKILRSEGLLNTFVISRPLAIIPLLMFLWEECQTESGGPVPALGTDPCYQRVA